MSEPKPMTNFNEIVDVASIGYGAFAKMQSAKFTRESVFEALLSLANADFVARVVKAIKDAGEVKSEVVSQFQGFEGTAGSKCRYVGAKLHLAGDAANKIGDFFDRSSPALLPA